MKTLSIIMTHKEALPAVRRHLPIWNKHLEKIVFTSPVDSMMGSELEETGIGNAEHNGEISAQRIMKIFEFALSYPETWEYLLLLEYDALALGLPEYIFSEGVSAAKYSQNKPIKFKGKFYLHYPMLFKREAFERVYSCLDAVKTRDRYFSDRFIGKAVELARIPVKDLIREGKAYSKNTIKQEHHKALKQAVRNGAIFFHGIKTEETLRIILENAP